MITANGARATLEFPVGVSEIETEDGIQYLADTVYSIKTENTPNLLERAESNFDAWLEVAKIAEPQKATLDDAIEAINALTDIIIGG